MTTKIVLIKKNAKDDFVILSIQSFDNGVNRQQKVY